MYFLFQTDRVHLRVSESAVAAVKGMADGVGKPCYGISTLETIAYPFFDRNCVVCSLMDARCSQVYTALFENGKRLDSRQRDAHIGVG